ncbi:MAG: SGNH/GDSL hydrolase family protein [Deltaproteobacteria bacterium]|nr:SGNH/GDSL hydrolase family protein [Deltaproteobacteria bacterium]
MGSAPASDGAALAAPRWRRLRARLTRVLPSRTGLARGLRIVGIVLIVVGADFAAEALWPYPLHHWIDEASPRISPSYRRFAEPTDGLARVAFHLRPTARTRAVTLYFGLDGELIESSFESLFLSAIPGMPSAYQRFRDGQLVERVELGDAPGAAAPVRFQVRFEGERLVVVRDGVVLPAVPFTLGARSLGFALYPSYPAARYRADYDRIEKLRFVLERGGERSVVRGWGPWTGWWGRPFFLAAIAIGLWWKSNRSRAARVALVALPSTLLALPTVLVLMTAIRGPWAAKDERFFDANGFRLERYLASRGHAQPLPADAIVVASFGGSSTEGDPYDRPTDTYDYPSRLQALLRGTDGYRDREVEVLNMGKVGVSFDSIIQIMDDVLPRVRPRVITLSSVYNNAFGFKVTSIFAHVTGHPGADASGFGPNFESFEHALGCIADLTRGNGATPLWIEEFVDRRYFLDRDLLGEYQALLARVASERGVDLVRFQDDVDREPNRLLFFEYVHPTSLGYDWMARRLGEWFVANREKVLAPLPDPPPTRRASEIELCREFLR